MKVPEATRRAFLLSLKKKEMRTQVGTTRRSDGNIFGDGFDFRRRPPLQMPVGVVG